MCCCMQSEREKLPEESHMIKPERRPASKPKERDKNRRRERSPNRSSEESSTRSRSGSPGRSNVSGGSPRRHIKLPVEASELEIRSPLFENHPIVPMKTLTEQQSPIMRPRSRHSSQNLVLPCDAKPKFTVKCKGCKHPVEAVFVRIAGADLPLTRNDGVTTGNVPSSDQPATPLVIIPSSEDWRYQPDDGTVAPISIKQHSTEEAVLYVKCLVLPTVEVRLVKNRVEDREVAGIPVTFDGKSMGDTQGDGWARFVAGSQGFADGDYTVALAPRTREYFVAADDLQPKTDQPFNVSVADGQANHFKYRVRRRARPTVKVICDETNKPVPAVTVSFGGRQWEKTGADGIATLQPDEWIDAANYKIALTFDDPSHLMAFEGETYSRFELIDSENPAHDIDDDDTREFLVKVHTTGALVVEVFRYDGKELQRRVTFNLLTGPSAKNGLQTASTPKDDDDSTGKDPRLADRVQDPLAKDPTEWRSKTPTRRIERDRLAVAPLRPGTYHVQLCDITDIKAGEKASVGELWSIGPDDTGKLTVKIVAEKVARVRFVLTKVRKIQFIAFDISPSTKPGGTLPSGNLYLTDPDATKDLGQRCIVLQNAIKKAKAMGVDARPEVLKVFMAPEFYFRGTEGAYEVGMVDSIMSEMRKLTSGSDYQDWLFVHGTAIGYTRHSDYNQSASTEAKTITTLKVHSETPGSVTGTVTGNATVVVATPLTVTVTGGVTLTGLRKGPFSANATVTVTGVGAITGNCTVTPWDATSGTFTLTGPGTVAGNGAATGTVTAPTTIVTVKDGAEAPVVSGKAPRSNNASDCSRINVGKGPDNYVWTIDGQNIQSVAANTTNAGMYDLTLDGTVALGADVELAEPIATEIINVAMVQKGGSGDGVAGLREAVIYKETISSVDFTTKHYAKPEFSKDQLIEVHGQERTALPTVGATHTLGQNPQTGSEFNERGTGGGSIFMVDGITFGLEVCLDHTISRLGKYYASGTPPSGEPKLQVLLVPSMGASLDSGEVPGVNGALMFNVDANDGSAAGKRQGDEPYACACHPTNKSSRRLECNDPTLPHYKCDGRSKFKKCPHCAKTMFKERPDPTIKVCPDSPHACPGNPANCAVCGQPTDKHAQCSTHNWQKSNSSGTCSVSGCTIAVTETAWCFQQHQLGTVTHCPDHPTAVLVGGTKCPAPNHRYHFTTTDCPHCAGALQKLGHCRTHNWQTPTGTGRCPTCDGALTSIGAYCFTAHTFIAAPPLTPCPQHTAAVAVDGKTYYCESHKHYQATAGNCTHVGCNTPVQLYDAPVAYVMAQNAPSIDKSADVVANDPGTYSTINYDKNAVVDGSTVKSQYTETVVNDTPDQAKLFVAPGKVTVYAVMDVPEAEAVQ